MFVEHTDVSQIGYFLSKSYAKKKQKWVGVFSPNTVYKYLYGALCVYAAVMAARRRKTCCGRLTLYSRSSSTFTGPTKSLPSISLTVSNSCPPTWLKPLPRGRYPTFQFIQTVAAISTRRAAPMVDVIRVLSRTSYQEGVSKNRGRMSHTDIPVTYLLTYLLECCCVYLVHPKFDLNICSNKSRQNSLLAVSV